MLAHPIDFDKVGAGADGVGECCLLVESFAELVEVGNAELGAQLDLAGIGLDFAQDQPEQRGLAAAVGADQSDLVAAQNTAGKIVYHAIVAAHFVLV